MLGTDNISSANHKTFAALDHNICDLSKGSITKPELRTDKGKTMRNKHEKDVGSISVNGYLNNTNRMAGPINVSISEITLVKREHHIKFNLKQGDNTYRICQKEL